MRNDNFHKGVWRSKNGNIPIHFRIAIEDDRMKSLQEAAIMAQLKHPNIVSYYGVLKDGLQVMIDFVIEE